MQFKIKFYEDSGHGWGAVKRQLLVDLGIADQISTFSYQKGGTVYLEEDCDLPLLVRTLKAKAGVTGIDWQEYFTEGRHPIRSYHHYSRKTPAA